MMKLKRLLNYFNNGLDYIGWINLVENLNKAYPYKIDKDFLDRSLVEGDVLRSITKDNDQWSYDDLTARCFYDLKSLTKKQTEIVKDAFENISTYVSEYAKKIGTVNDYSLYVVFLEKKNNYINLVFSFKILKGENKGSIFDYTIKL